MRRFVAAAFFVLLPAQVFAKEHLRRFRGPEPSLDTMDSKSLAIAKVSESLRQALPGVGEWVARSQQSAGGAQVSGAWEQKIFDRGGQLIYSAGELADDLPAAANISANSTELTLSLQHTLESEAELLAASSIFPPTLELDKDSEGRWVPHWRVEYLSPKGDELRYLQVSGKGQILARGHLDWDGVDGRAMVFPKGPKQSAVSEAPLRDLSGDGTITGKILHVVSALGLKVWSPDLTFFFPDTDRRFDLGQAYFTIDQGYRWLKERLGVELRHPITVKLHVGDGGVSNAAFYHQRTIYLGTGDGETYQNMLRDPSILIHEGIHAVIDAYTGLPSEGEGGGFNEGFADLFTALILENPRLGEVAYMAGPYRRTLEHGLKAYQDFAPGVYQNGSIVAATFWDMRSFLGTELTAKLAFRTLVRLGKGGRFDDLPAALLSAADGLLSETQKMNAAETARKRGWRVP